MKILVTGGTGFIGRHVVRCLRANNYNVLVGTRRIPQEKGAIQFFLDTCSWMEMMIDKYEIDCIVHLSGRASVGSSFNEPYETYENNVRDTINLLKVVSEKFKHIRLIVTGSSEIYTPTESVLTESSSFGPVSPYGFTKVFIDTFSRSIAKRFSLSLVVTRPFNIIGPEQSEIFVMSNFAKQLAEMQLYKREKILRVGNLEVSRDFVDVRDIATAYMCLINGDEIGSAYNICSGKSYKLIDCINKLIEIASIKDIKIEKDKSRLRPTDIKSIVGDNLMIKDEYGWTQNYMIEKTFEDILEYWRNKLNES